MRGLSLIAATVALATADELSLTDRVKGAFFGALVADALCLGSHYEYDAPTIKNAYGGKSIQTYMAPGEHMGGTTHGVGWGRRQYHPGQKKGDQTDYGEYNVLILEHLASRGKRGGKIKLKELIPHWQARLNSPQWGAWKCTQTRQTLQQVASNTPFSALGGMSNAMAMRAASAIAAFDTESEAAAAARATSFTHRHEEALAGSEFFVRVAWKVAIDGLRPREAIKATADQMSSWIQAQVAKGVAKFEEATDGSRPLSKEEFVDDLAVTSMARLWDVGKTEPIKVGKASPTEGVLPSSVYFILKYEDDMVAAMQANAMVGGDNASRSVAIGMVLGAFHGASAVPQHLRSGLNAWEKCEALLNKVLPTDSTKSEL